MSDFSKIRQTCISEAKKKIREGVNSDTLIVQAISCIDELDLLINKVATRVREWYSWYNPEFVLMDNEKYIEIILRKDKKTLQKECRAKESMGKDLDKEDLNAIMDAAKQVWELVKLRDKEKKYLEKVLEKHCKSTVDVLGSQLAAKLIRHAGSIERLAMTPATVIQIMGAEKALFKHISGKGKSPKYGLIATHHLISAVGRSNKGKMARAIADKAAIAIKVDHFKGEYIGQKLKKFLEDKAKKLNS